MGDLPYIHFTVLYIPMHYTSCGCLVSVKKIGLYLILECHFLSFVLFQREKCVWDIALGMEQSVGFRHMLDSRMSVPSVAYIHRILIVVG